MHRRPLRALVSALALTLLLAATVAAPLVVRAGGGCHAANGSVYTEGESTVVKMDVCSFVPTVIRVPSGSTIRFLNTDVQEHMVVGRAGSWASGLLSPGQEYGATFTAKGTYPYSCPLHPGMVGAVVVGDGIGLSGGAAVGVPESVVPTSAPSTVASAQVHKTAAGSATTAAPDHAATASAPDQGTLAIAATIGAVSGVLLGLLVAGAIAVRRRRPEAATTR